MKHLFIINPTAGKGKALEYKDIIEAYFKDKDDEYDIKITDRPGHAIEILRDYDYNEECNVYSIGGDGTFNEVVNALRVQYNSLTPEEQATFKPAIVFPVNNRLA